MKEAVISIVQGSEGPYPPADINVVIDVIRAFTVAHVAFLRKASQILLVNTVAEAMAQKAGHPEYLLAGEIEGLGIPGFDLDNSPYRFSQASLAGRTLVQKTTNGVKATLAALDARHVFVTGFSNARRTAHHVRALMRSQRLVRVNVIASHGRDDDDLACAEFIRDQILGGDGISAETVARRIRASRPAAKFLSRVPNAFEPRDLDFCVRELDGDFVMEVDRSREIPRITSKMAAIESHARL
jgi:2-phosphosulfolactate phosphatase